MSENNSITQDKQAGKLAIKNHHLCLIELVIQSSHDSVYSTLIEWDPLSEEAKSKCRLIEIASGPIKSKKIGIDGSRVVLILELNIPKQSKKHPAGITSVMYETPSKYILDRLNYLNESSQEIYEALASNEHPNYSKFEEFDQIAINQLIAERMKEGSGETLSISEPMAENNKKSENQFGSADHIYNLEIPRLALINGFQTTSSTKTEKFKFLGLTGSGTLLVVTPQKGGKIELKIPNDNLFNEVYSLILQRELWWEITFEETITSIKKAPLRTGTLLNITLNE